MTTSNWERRYSHDEQMALLQHNSLNESKANRVQIAQKKFLGKPLGSRELSAISGQTRYLVLVRYIQKILFLFVGEWGCLGVWRGVCHVEALGACARLQPRRHQQLA
jgi:hypothetical protein